MTPWLFCSSIFGAPFFQVPDPNYRNSFWCRYLVSFWGIRSRWGSHLAWPMSGLLVSTLNPTIATIHDVEVWQMFCWLNFAQEVLPFLAVRIMSSPCSKSSFFHMLHSTLDFPSLHVCITPGHYRDGLQDICTYFPDAAVCGVKSRSTVPEEANKLMALTHQLHETWFPALGKAVDAMWHGYVFHWEMCLA